MRNKILNIKELPKITTLENGYYIGEWGGHSIIVKHKNKEYELETEDGVRGIGYKVIVEINDGVATYEEVVNGTSISILKDI